MVGAVTPLTRLFSPRGWTDRSNGVDWRVQSAYIYAKTAPKRSKPL